MLFGFGTQPQFLPLFWSTTIESCTGRDAVFIVSPWLDARSLLSVAPLVQECPETSPRWHFLSHREQAPTMRSGLFRCCGVSSDVCICETGNGEHCKFFTQGNTFFSSDKWRKYILKIRTCRSKGRYAGSTALGLISLSHEPAASMCLADDSSRSSAPVWIFTARCTTREQLSRTGGVLY